VYIVLGLLAVCFVLVLIIVSQWKRIKKVKEQNDYFAAEIKHAAQEVKCMRGHIDKTKTITEEANDKRKELSETPDAGLAGRANTLFGGGLHDKANGGSGGT
jgi:uncharacterized protein YoxC